GVGAAEGTAEKVRFHPRTCHRCRQGAVAACAAITGNNGERNSSSTQRSFATATVTVLKFPSAEGANNALNRVPELSRRRSPMTIVERALELVPNDSRIGLGSGRAAQAFIRALGERIRSGRLRVQGVPTSKETASLARQEGIPLLNL